MSFKLVYKNNKYEYRNVFKGGARDPDVAVAAQGVESQVSILVWKICVVHLVDLHFEVDDYGEVGEETDDEGWADPPVDPHFPVLQRFWSFSEDEVYYHVNSEITREQFHHPDLLLEVGSIAQVEEPMTRGHYRNKV